MQTKNSPLVNKTQNINLKLITIQTQRCIIELLARNSERLKAMKTLSQKTPSCKDATKNFSGQGRFLE